MASNPTFLLAQDLLREDRFKLSAVEFRRFAMETDKKTEQAAAYLYASYAYQQAGELPSANEMLDRAENSDVSSAYLDEHALLSAENARKEKDIASALYFYGLLSENDEKTDFKTFACHRTAAIKLAEGNLPAARIQLKESPSDESSALLALDAYADGKDKSPLIGGLWGLIPGAGYWYSGEVANGFRSLILNSLFIYGLVQTAGDDEWGAFGVIAFFEVTWYSGSIYGGIDSAHRHNKERIDKALDAIDGHTTYHPDSSIIAPIFKIKILF